jgi:hypothetical protein
MPSGASGTCKRNKRRTSAEWPFASDKLRGNRSNSRTTLAETGIDPVGLGRPAMSATAARGAVEFRSWDSHPGISNQQARKETNMARKNHSTKQQTSSFAASTAMSVQLVGDFTHWQEAPIAMKKGPNGVWKASVDLSPGTHHYRFLVDGQWRDDPECTLRVANPFGSQDAFRQVF